MTYARARLWLGISGVGLLVVLTGTLAAMGLPARILPTETTWQPLEPLALAAIVGVFLLWMLPFDLLGGYLLPRRFGRPTPGFAAVFRNWLLGVALQSALFVLFGTLLLAAGRTAGVPGALAAVALLAVGQLALQGLLARLLLRDVTTQWAFRLSSVRDRLARWSFPLPRMIVVQHLDAGFTGGVTGLPGRETIIVPRGWMDVLSDDQLAAALARRVEAIRSGSRTRGLVVAAAWILAGFALSSSLPGGGVTSVAELATTLCGFTLWSFLGLLILPTISRNASYSLDARVIAEGVPSALLRETVSVLDRLQDDEPSRPAVVETIFHPVPSVDNRFQSKPPRHTGAWHAARMTLFLSWSCLGLLSRAVHCNAGRPELWIMLPTD